jgi:hypothetical protein
MNIACSESCDISLVPGRLWSLLDIMRRLSLNKFIGAYQHLSAFQHSMAMQSDSIAISANDIRDLQNSVIILATIMEENGMLVALESARKVLSIIDNIHIQKGLDPGSWLRLETFCKDILGRVGDEFASQHVLIIPPDKIMYYEPVRPPFGQDAQDKFPSSIFEVDEAGKCYVMGRHTAAVFHLMRTMEIGIRAVARCLEVPDPVKPAERNWAFILREMKKGIEAREKSLPKSWSDPADKQFFDDMHVSLDAVKNVWRNPTMHVERTYTDEEAEHIYGAVRGFMKKLASRCDEWGQPTA